MQSLAHSAAVAMGGEYRDLLLSWEEEDVAKETVPEPEFCLPISTATSATLTSPSPRSSKGRKPRTPRREDVPKPEEKIVGYWQSAIAAERRKAAASPGRRSLTTSLYKGPAIRINPDGSSSFAEQGESSSTLPDTEEVLPVAFEIARTKNLKKAVDYLIACDFLTPSPRDVAAFLRLHRAQLDPSALGIFLAEGGTAGGDVDYWNQIRFNYFRPISFVGMNVEQGYVRQPKCDLVVVQYLTRPSLFLYILPG